MTILTVIMAFILAVGLYYVVSYLSKINRDLNSDLNRIRVERYFLQQDIIKHLKLLNKDDECELMKIELQDRQNEKQLKKLYVPTEIENI